MEQDNNLNRRKVNSSSNLSSQQELNEDKKTTISSIKETPSYLQREFILNGYRVEYNSHTCMLSLFHWHNETLNVWTHIAGFLLFIYYTIKNIINTKEDFQVNFSEMHFMDKLMLGIFFFGGQSCFLLSSIYHLMACQSKSAYKLYSELDYFGISTFISSCLIASIYYGFYCDPALQITYTSICILFCILTSSLMHLPQLQLPSLKNFRIAAFFFQISFCVIPMAHWIVRKGIYHEEVMHTFPRIIIMFILFLIGFFFYWSKIPERFAPGKFDFIFSSHQIWHVIVIFAAVFQYSQLTGHYSLKYKECGGIPR